MIGLEMMLHELRRIGREQTARAEYEEWLERDREQRWKQQEELYGNIQSKFPNDVYMHDYICGFKAEMEEFNDPVKIIIRSGFFGGNYNPIALNTYNSSDGELLDEYNIYSLDNGTFLYHGEPWLYQENKLNDYTTEISDEKKRVVMDIIRAYHYDSMNNAEKKRCYINRANNILKKYGFKWEFTNKIYPCIEGIDGSQEYGLYDFLMDGVTIYNAKEEIYVLAAERDLLCDIKSPRNDYSVRIEKCIVNCPKCNQGIRIPKHAQNMGVWCSKCHSLLNVNEGIVLNRQEDVISTSRMQSKKQSVLIESGQDGFKSYFFNIDDKDIMRSISTEYYRILNQFPTPPTLGEYGSIEFSGVLLMWQYCRENSAEYKNTSVIGSFMIGIGEVIGCSFYQMPASEWSDKLDKVINAHPEILSYDEWDEIYISLKENHRFEIKSMPYNNGLYDSGMDARIIDRSRETTYRLFCEEYNRMSSYNSGFLKFQNDGIRLLEDIPFDFD